MSLGQIVKDIHSCILWIEFICSPKNIQNNLNKKTFQNIIFLRNRKGFYLPLYLNQALFRYSTLRFFQIFQNSELSSHLIFAPSLHTFHFYSQKYVSLWPFSNFSLSSLTIQKHSIVFASLNEFLYFVKISHSLKSALQENLPG